MPFVNEEIPPAYLENTVSAFPAPAFPPDQQWVSAAMHTDIPLQWKSVYGSERDKPDPYSGHSR